MTDWSGLLQLLPLLAVPLIGAAIGWLTNRMAIQLLFRPRLPRRWLGISFQGLIPRRKEEIAQRVGRLVAEELFQQHRIREEIQRIDLEPTLEKLTHRVVYDRLAPRLKQIPLLGSFISERILQTLHQLALDSIREEARPLLNQIALDVEQRIQVRHLVEDKIRQLELDHLETLVRQLAQQEFRQIELLGAVIGFLIGLVQAGLLWAIT